MGEGRFTLGMRSLSFNVMALMGCVVYVLVCMSLIIGSLFVWVVILGCRSSGVIRVGCVR